MTTKYTLPKRYAPTGITLPGGGMSDAIVCNDSHLDRQVVIKSLKDGTDPKRLLDELSALLQIRSKHVVQIYDVIAGANGTVAAIVEEYLPGNDLLKAPTPQTAGDALKLLYPVAEGIADIHSHDRIHRDIKPNNMKYDAEGCLKIFDFGLSRIEGVDADTVAIIGTKGFLAPELFVDGASGKKKFTRAIDTFAFGASTLMLLTGSLPNSLKQLPPKLGGVELDFSSLKVGLPADVATILTRTLSADFAARPTMAEVTAVIAAHLLRGRHRALLTANGKRYELDITKPSAVIGVAGKGSLRITYDGMHFRCDQIAGGVYINNTAIANGYTISGACVIVLGTADMGAARVNITMDVSHPEVTL